MTDASLLPDEIEEVFYLDDTTALGELLALPRVIVNRGGGLQPRPQLAHPLIPDSPAGSWDAVVIADPDDLVPAEYWPFIFQEARAQAGFMLLVGITPDSAHLDSTGWEVALEDDTAVLIQDQASDEEPDDHTDCPDCSDWPPVAGAVPPPADASSPTEVSVGAQRSSGRG